MAFTKKNAQLLQYYSIIKKVRVPSMVNQKQQAWQLLIFEWPKSCMCKQEHLILTKYSMKEFRLATNIQMWEGVGLIKRINTIIRRQWRVKLREGDKVQKVNKEINSNILPSMWTVGQNMTLILMSRKITNRLPKIWHLTNPSTNQVAN